tara:strand:- start:5720 stop:6004 length:285 start_codon:yes stop_codon:yes gene_type:complete
VSDEQTPETENKNMSKYNVIAVCEKGYFVQAISWDDIPLARAQDLAYAYTQLKQFGQHCVAVPSGVCSKDPKNYVHKKTNQEYLAGLPTLEATN